MIFYLFIIITIIITLLLPTSTIIMTSLLVLLLQLTKLINISVQLHSVGNNCGYSLRNVLNFTLTFPTK